MGSAFWRGLGKGFGREEPARLICESPQNLSEFQYGLGFLSLLNPMPYGSLDRAHSGGVSQPKTKRSPGPGLRASVSGRETFSGGFFPRKTHILSVALENRGAA